MGQFSAVAYDSTVQAYLLLDAATSASQSAADNDSGIVEMLGSTAATSASLSDAMMVTGATANLPATVQADVMDSIETITKDTVVAALAGTLEQNAALASRTGSFMDASAGAATTPSGVPLQELRDQSLPALCAQLQAHQVVPVMMRVYKLLTDQLYQHYLICQWHRRPFDRRNQDLAFLHRCGLDDNDPASPMPGDDADGSTGEAKGTDVGGGEGDVDGVAAAGVTSPGASVEPPTLGRRERAVLDHVARGLMQDRKVSCRPTHMARQPTRARHACYVPCAMSTCPALTAHAVLLAGRVAPHSEARRPDAEHRLPCAGHGTAGAGGTGPREAHRAVRERGRGVQRR